MRGIAVGGSPDWGDYWNIVYGATDDLPPEFRLPWIVNGKSEPMKGIFDPNHPDPRCAYVQKRIHAVGFICEKHHYGSTFIKENIALHYNQNFYSDLDAVRELWPLSPPK